MFKRVKKWLGIEGLKLELTIPEKSSFRANAISGKIKCTSIQDQVIKEIHIRLVERYSRGRKKNRLVDEYKLGEIILKEEMVVKAHQIVEIEFELPFVHAKSEMDLLGERNFLTKALVRTAKWARRVKSEYRVLAEARVKGTKLHAFAEKEIRFV